MIGIWRERKDHPMHCHTDREEHSKYLRDESLHNQDLTAMDLKKRNLDPTNPEQGLWLDGSNSSSVLQPKAPRGEYHDHYTLPQPHSLPPGTSVTPIGPPPMALSASMTTSCIITITDSLRRVCTLMMREQDFSMKRQRDTHSNNTLTLREEERLVCK